MKTKTTNKQTSAGHITPVKAMTDALASHTDKHETRNFTDMLIDFVETLSKRSLAETKARKKLQADFVHFKSQTNEQIAELKAPLGEVSDK